MALSSSQISQAMAAQNSMFSGQIAMSQQLSYQSLAALNPGMQPPSPAAAFNHEFNYGQKGQDAFMGGAAFMGGTAMPFLGAGVAGFGALNSLTGLGGMAGRAASMFDPFTAMWGAGRMGYGMAGMGGAALGAAAAFLPFYAASTAASTYGGAAYGGMQDQSAINSMLGQNFNFAGGGGMMGRGFSQGQMGQIGGMMHQMSRQDPFSSLGELTSLAGVGSQMGMFTAVRDVKEFTRKFKEMIGTLKTVQDELGGSLQEALQFVNQAKQSGIYKSSDRAMFSGLVRRTSDISGLSQDSVMQMTSFGSHLSRSLGGTGAQGAVGATLALRQIGAAVQGGIIDGEMLSEATGGLTGDDAVMALSQNMMQRAGRATRGAFGRYSIFGLANEDASGIDQGKMSRFLSGDMSMSEISRSAHQTVGRIGRPRAMRNEGLLRSAALQQGGMLFEAGKMKALLGDRVMMQDDDLVQAVIQRRFRMNRGEATAMTAMIRNLPEIATRMAIDAEESDISRAQTDFRQENQSFESIKRRISSAVNEGLGVADAREWGRKLYSTVGSAVERFTDDLFGIARQEFNQTGRDRVRRVMMGQGTASDFAALAASDAKMGGAFSGAAQLKAGFLQRGPSEGAFMQASGYNVAGLSGADGYAQYLKDQNVMNMALESGYVTGDSKAALAQLSANPASTLEMLSKAKRYGGGDRAKVSDYIKRRGGDPVAYMAYTQREGLDAGFGDSLTGTIQSGNSAFQSWNALVGNTILGAIGFDYSGTEGGAQHLEDLMDRYGRTGAGIEESDIASAFTNDKFRESVQAYLKDPKSVGLDGMRRAAMSKGLGKKESAAGLGIIATITQLEQSGMNPEDFRKALATASQGSDEDRANLRAQMNAAARMRGQYGVIADSLTGPAAEAFASVATEGDYSGIRRGQLALVDMSPEERNAALSGMEDSTASVAVRQAVGALARQRRELGGQGRGRQAGARNAMHAMFGAGVSEGLEVTLDNGRILNSRQSRRMLDKGLMGRGGAAGKAALVEYRDQLMGQVGLSPEEADTMLTQQMNVMSDGRITPEEAKQLQEQMSPEASKKLTEYQKKNQARNDPLAEDRNKHLKTIAETGIESLVISKEMLRSQNKAEKYWSSVNDKIEEAKVKASEAS